MATISRLGTLIVAWALAAGAYSDSMTMEGTYTIPLPEEMREHSVLSFKDYEVEDENGSKFMSFQLPEDLGGGSVINCNFRLLDTRNPKFTRWASSQGELQCTGLWDNLACVVRFNAIDLNKKSRHDFLESKYAGEPELLSIKKEVSDRFHSEPIGFIAIREMM